MNMQALYHDRLLKQRALNNGNNDKVDYFGRLVQTPTNVAEWPKKTVPDKNPRNKK